MVKKVLIGLVLCMVVLGGFFIFDIQELNNGGIDMEEEKVFYGPVQEGYNQEHFWKTGETIPLE